MNGIPLSCMNHFHFAEPVLIKVENVTGEKIQLSWTSEDSKRGSLYTIFLMDGIREINKTTTSETTIMFKHLLPGHVYTVSVEVLSCAENSRTSVTVRTGISSIVLSFIFNGHTLRMFFCNVIWI